MHQMRQTMIHPYQSTEYFRNVIPGQETSRGFEYVQGSYMSWGFWQYSLVQIDNIDLSKVEKCSVF